MFAADIGVSLASRGLRSKLGDDRQSQFAIFAIFFVAKMWALGLRGHSDPTSVGHVWLIEVLRCLAMIVSKIAQVVRTKCTQNNA